MIKGVLKSLLFPRYLKEHTAVALGIVAVVVVAIVALTKQLGPLQEVC